MTSGLKKSNLLLRPANEDDREALGDLKLRATLAWGDHTREVLLALGGADELAADLLAASFVAEVDGRIVGFATLVTKDDLEAEVEELFIEPNEWRKGIGTRLIEEAERRAAVAGASRLRVAANPRAEAFYQACGFRVIGKVRDSFGFAPLMQKQLS
jgi:GNAT superfamily N-acetyltransferase